ncbi:MAG: 50S ribosomal protein L1, partial [Candidatus Saccharimonadales bacterium]
MAKKADLLEKAAELKLEVSEKNTIAEIEAAIASAEKHEVKEAAPAKAGKRSEKSLREADEKAEKEARKETGDTSSQSGEEENRKKGPAPKVRSRLERRGKNYRKVNEQLEAGKVYPLAEAIELAAKTNPSKFDASVEVHVRLGVDPRQADQNIRATVTLPNGSGKTVRVAVYAPESDHEAAKKAGADVVGDETFLKQLDKEELNFDVLVATPQYMPKLGKYARLLGPRGLMPNPKSGTVATDVAKAVTEAKAGKVEYRVDK